MCNDTKVLWLVEEVYLGVHLQSSSHTFETMLEKFKDAEYYLGMIKYDSDYYELTTEYNDNGEPEYSESYKFGNCMYRTVFDLLWFNYGEKIIPYIKPYFNKDTLKTAPWVTNVLLKMSISLFLIYNDRNNINSVENKSRINMVKFLNENLSREELDEVMLDIMKEKVQKHYEIKEMIFNMKNIFNLLNISDDIFSQYVYYETKGFMDEYFDMKYLSNKEIDELFQIPQISTKVNEIASKTLEVFYESEIYVSYKEFTNHLCKYVTNIDFIKNDNLLLKISSMLLGG